MAPADAEAEAEAESDADGDADAEADGASTVMARDELSCASVPDVTSCGAGATSTTSATCVESPAEADADAEAESETETSPGSPGAASDRSTVASAASGHTGAGNSLANGSASCCSTVPTDCDATTGVSSLPAAAAVGEETATADNKLVSNTPTKPSDTACER